MSELIVFAFENEGDAMVMRDRLLDYQKRKSLPISDATVAVRRQDGKVKVKQLTNLVPGGALGGGFLGVFIGLLFAVPVAGLFLGVAGGAIVAALSDYGVDDKFIKEVSETLEPGTSALFLLASKSELDKALAEVSDLNPTILQTTLSDEDEVALADAFGGHE